MDETLADSLTANASLLRSMASEQDRQARQMFYQTEKEKTTMERKDTDFGGVIANAIAGIVNDTVEDALEEFGARLDMARVHEQDALQSKLDAFLSRIASLPQSTAPVAPAVAVTPTAHTEPTPAKRGRPAKAPEDTHVTPGQTTPTPQQTSAVKTTLDNTPTPAKVDASNVMRLADGSTLTFSGTQLQWVDVVKVSGNTLTLTVRLEPDRNAMPNADWHNLTPYSRGIDVGTLTQADGTVRNLVLGVKVAAPLPKK
jgi:hypothetical protein